MLADKYDVEEELAGLHIGGIIELPPSPASALGGSLVFAHALLVGMYQRCVRYGTGVVGIGVPDAVRNWRVVRSK